MRGRRQQSMRSPVGGRRGPVCVCEPAGSSAVFPSVLVRGERAGQGVGVGGVGKRAVASNSVTLGNKFGCCAQLGRLSLTLAAGMFSQACLTPHCFHPKFSHRNVFVCLKAVIGMQI